MVPTGPRFNHFLLFLTIFLSLTSLYRALSPLPLLSALCPGELLRLRRVAAQRIRCDRDRPKDKQQIRGQGGDGENDGRTGETEVR